MCICVCVRWSQRKRETLTRNYSPWLSVQQWGWAVCSIDVKQPRNGQISMKTCSLTISVCVCVCVYASAKRFKCQMFWEVKLSTTANPFSLTCQICSVSCIQNLDKSLLWRQKHRNCVFLHFLSTHLSRPMKSFHDMYAYQTDSHRVCAAPIQIKIPWFCLI